MGNVSKCAVLIDGGFFYQKYEVLHRKKPGAREVQGFVQKVMTDIRKTSDPAVTDVLLRSYYYDCMPYGKPERDPYGKIWNFAAKAVFKEKQKFLKDLACESQMDLRLGELSFDGWKITETHPRVQYRPDFKQKSVDMKIGLDIAWMAGKGCVNKIALVAADSDFVAPIKHARREGITVHLFTMGHKYTKKLLRDHSDFVW